MRFVSIAFDRERMHLVVELPQAGPLTTAEVPHLAPRLLKLLPALRRHRCRNNAHKTFSQEAANTEIPHLFEHLVLELQARVSEVRAFSGVTNWDWHAESVGRFTVSIDYNDMFVALATVRLAARVLRAVNARTLDPEVVEREIATLREIVALIRALGESVPGGAAFSPPAEAVKAISDVYSVFGATPGDGPDSAPD